MPSATYEDWKHRFTHELEGVIERMSRAIITAYEAEDELVQLDYEVHS
jgi:hypothetical protein